MDVVIAGAQLAATVTLVGVTIAYVRLTKQMAEATAAQATHLGDQARHDASRSAAGHLVRLSALATDLKIATIQGKSAPKLDLQRINAAIAEELRGIAVAQLDLEPGLRARLTLLQAQMTRASLASAMVVGSWLLLEREEDCPAGENPWAGIRRLYINFRDPGEAEWEEIDTGEVYDRASKQAHSIYLSLMG